MKPLILREAARAVSLCMFIVGVAMAEAADAQTDPNLEAQSATHTITKKASAVGYEVGSGKTKVDLRGTELMPQARGVAKVEIKSKAGRTNVAVDLRDMSPPSVLGAEFLTYVLWVVTPEGRTGNTGEILIKKDGEGELSATTPAQTFSLIVTAEPYF